MAKKPCFDTDLLKTAIPFTLKQRASIWKIVREDYTDHGVPFDKAVRAVANDLGWDPEAIIQALDGPKSGPNPRRLTAGVWKREAMRKATLQEAKALIYNANRSLPVRAASRIWNAAREAAVWGHFAVFPATHMKDSFLIPTEWKNVAVAYKKAWGLARRDWQSFHEQQKFTIENDPQYWAAKKSGLDVTLASESYLSPNKRASAAFDFIKEQRLEIWKRWAKDLPPEEQKIFSQYLNHATGAVKYDSAKLQSLMGQLTFAPKLLPAQIMTVTDLPKAFVSLAKGRKATLGERTARSFVFRRMAQLAATQTAILGANYVAGQVWGKDWAPNLTDRTKASWLRLHIAGHSVIISPTLEWMKFPIRLLSKAMNSRNQEESIVMDTWRQFSSRAHPSVNLSVDGLLGKETFSGRPLPFRGLIGAPKATPSKPEVTKTEFFLGRAMPIPLAAGSRELFDAMRAEGLDAPTAKAWTEFAIGTAVGSTGFHEHRDYPEPKKEYKPTKHGGLLQSLMERFP